jgi:cysteine sulfinate desulfinase/cysteine desulfurase-like protein
MKIFDQTEAITPLAAKFNDTYWLNSSSRGSSKKTHEAHSLIAKSLGLKQKDQALLFMHKKIAAKKLFQSILEQKIQESGKIHCLISKDLDPFILEAIDELAAKGCMKILLPTTNEGKIDIKELKKCITFKSCFLSCSYSNPKTGLIEDVLEIARICKDNELLFHLDFDEAIGPYFLDFSTIGCDFLTLNCNTVGAELGASVLAIKKDSLETMQFDPLMAGTLFNTAHALSEFSLQSKERLLEIARQRRLFEAQMIEELGAIILLKGTSRRANICLLKIPGIHHESLALFLRQKQIIVGLNYDLNCLQIHFPLHVTYEEIQALTKELIACTKKLNQIAGQLSAV